MLVLVAREGRASHLPVRERIQGPLVRVGSRAAVIWAKVRSGLPVRKDKQFVISVISLDM